MVVGAYALAFHGVPRYTGDIDRRAGPTTGNAVRLLAAIREFGFSPVGLTAEDFLAADRVERLGAAPNRTDRLTSIPGVPFEQAWQDRVEAERDGVPVAFLSHECLIRNKRAAGRAQDRADLDALEGGR